MRNKQNILTENQLTSSECSWRRASKTAGCAERGETAVKGITNVCMRVYICDPFHFKRWCIFIQEGAAGSCADGLLSRMQLISFFSLISALRPVIWECHFLHHSIVKISNYAEAVKSFLGNFFFLYSSSRSFFIQAYSPWSELVIDALVAVVRQQIIKGYIIE